MNTITQIQTTPSASLPPLHEGNFNPITNKLNNFITKVNPSSDNVSSKVEIIKIIQANYRILAMDKNEIIKYWETLAENDVAVMQHLFDSRDFNYCLYIGHLVLEKILKAHFVKANDDVPPRTHDLVKLASKSGIELTDDFTNKLLLINTFNIEARYPDEKFSFYKMCTREFADIQKSQIMEIYLWLKSQL